MLRRFIQPDSIVPSVANPQAWDRYAYTLNNPIRYNDPTGHRNCEEDDYDCPGSSYSAGGNSNNGNGGNNGGGLISALPAGPACTQNACTVSSPSNKIIGYGSSIGGGSNMNGGGNNTNKDGKIVSVNPSQTLTYHPLDSNVVYQQTIFDYSYYPPKPIGYDTGFYVTENVQTDWGRAFREFLPIPDLSQPISLKNVDSVYILKEGVDFGLTKSMSFLEIFGIQVAEDSDPVGWILRGASAVDSYNNNTIITGQFHIKIAYYPIFPGSSMLDPIGGSFYTKRK